jgi:hypothetical protein
MAYQFGYPAAAIIPGLGMHGNADAPAPVIGAGAVLNINDVNQSRRELRSRKRMRELGQVPENVVSESEFRHHDLISEHAVNLISGAAAPAWFTPLVARMDNAEARIRNCTRVDAANNGVPNAVASVLLPLRKINVGLGPPLPGGAAGGAGLMAPPVGAVVGAPFPATVAALNAITAAHLNTLARLFSDQFGIVAGDGLPKKRQKFSDFVCGR